MPKEAVQLANAFIGHLRTLEFSHNKAKKLLSGRQMVARDAELLVCGLFLEAVSSFEWFLEELLIGLVSGSHSISADIGPKAVISNKTVCREMILGGRDYVDWLPYSRFSLPRAKAYLRGGRPFTALGQDVLREISRAQTVRNAIAHKSRHAQQKYEQKVLSGVPLRDKEKRVGAFLFSEFQDNPPTTRYQEIVSVLAEASLELAGKKKIQR